LPLGWAEGSRLLLGVQQPGGGRDACGELLPGHGRGTRPAASCQQLCAAEGAGGQACGR
ncbi:hypothetical protein HaLaN_25356, partial [Haematococcus lacustris]